jgi:hypothetical protein
MNRWTAVIPTHLEASRKPQAMTALIGPSRKIVILASSMKKFDGTHSPIGDGVQLPEFQPSTPT